MLLVLFARSWGYKGLILGVTGNALDEDVKEFIDHGADQVILKPLTKEIFRKVIEDSGKFSADVEGSVPVASSGDSELRIALRIEKALQQTPDRPAETVSSNERPKKQSSKNAKSVLIVDDSAMIRKMMTQLVRNLGHATEEAADGAAAVSLIKESMADPSRHYDAILLDNQMPIMQGKDAARIIREELGYKGLILGVTGNALDEDVKEFIDHGADQVILKPLTKETFRKVIEDSRKAL